MPAQYVKPYVKTNKSGYIDAEAIAEAVQRPTEKRVSRAVSQNAQFWGINAIKSKQFGASVIECANIR